MDEAYYRIQKPNGDQYMSICTLQWFDEFDYDQKLWLRDEQGEPLKFALEADARDFLNTYIDPRFIRWEDRSDDQEQYFLRSVDNTGFYL